MNIQSKTYETVSFLDGIKLILLIMFLNGDGFREKEERKVKKVSNEGISRQRNEPLRHADEFIIQCYSKIRSISQLFGLPTCIRHPHCTMNPGSICGHATRGVSEVEDVT